MKTKYVGCILIDKKEKILIIRYNINNFDKKHNRGLWGAPGGKIEENETEHQSIIRELKEETNIDYHKLDILESREWYQNHNNNTKIFLYKVKEIPFITLSDEHDKFKKTHISNLKKYKTTYSFNKAITYYNKLKK